MPGISPSYRVPSPTRKAEGGSSARWTDKAYLRQAEVVGAARLG